ncbi:MAG: hypothetical protein M0D57_02935 [Sphingobacteriales bacterium JAD_PAG50586_3]|nr:MAG: hypothetical protein M0D57_02935 [Sphingobacteriales bacterium JAD_PAG50586_3]
MNYLLSRKGRYYYNRRVPECFREFDSRDYIRIALGTTCRKQAAKFAINQNEQLESYWLSLVQTGQKHSQTAYQAVVQRAKVLGFGYIPSQQLAVGPLEQLIERLLHVQKANYNPHQSEAVLGGILPLKLILMMPSPVFGIWQKIKS